MSGKSMGLWMLAASLACLPGFAQQPKQQRTVEQRLSGLERQVASLETRLGVRTEPGAPSSAAIAVQKQATAQRIAQLEQRLSSLTAEVKRVERQADAAMRAANQAQRDATQAQQMARDAARRLR
jgi:septation ring formation regulator EzrA